MTTTKVYKLHTDASAAARDREHCVEFLCRNAQGDLQGCILPYAGLHVDYVRRPGYTEILVQSPEREVVIKSREASGIIEGLRQRRLTCVMEAQTLPERGRTETPDIRPDTTDVFENTGQETPDMAGRPYPVVDAITIRRR